MRLMKWLSIDPGETTGWALWEGDRLLDAGQEELVKFVDEVGESNSERCTCTDPFYVELLVIERFALYPWVARSGELDFDELRTSRGIGALEYIARQAGVRVVMQPATIKDPAQAAGARELFLSPVYENRHANDAIMHGWYYILTELKKVKLDIPAVTEANVIAVERFTAGEGSAV